MKSRSVIALAVGILLSLNAVAQTIKGRIFDAQTKEPVIGATVRVAQTQTGAITDVNGNFQLRQVAQHARLIISSVGYATQEIDASAAGSAAIALEPSIEDLQPIVVTGSREATLRTETPIAISRLSPKIIEESKPTALYEIVNKVPGVMMVNLNNEQHMMAIRQPMTTNAYFLYLEDGIPIRPMGVFNHNSLLEFNQFAISSVEVVKGPVSSIYGAEAVGGAINFITQRPTVVPTARIGIQVDQWGYKRVQYGAGATLGKIGVYIGGLVARQRDSWMTSSDYDKSALNTRLEYSFTTKTRLTAALSYNSYNSQTSGSVDSVAFYNRQYVSTTDFTYRKSYSLRTRLTLEHEWANGSQSFITAFIRDNKQGQNPAYSIIWKSGASTATGQMNSNDFKSKGVIAQHTQKLPFLNTKVIAGATVDWSPNTYWAYLVDLNAQLRADKRSVEKYTLAKERPEIQLAHYNADIHNTGLYAQVEFEPITRLRLSAGVRYDRMAFDYVNNLDPDKATGLAIGGTKQYSQTTPKLGLTYDLGKGKGLYVSYSKGFSPPALTAIFRKRSTPAVNGDLFYYTIQPAQFNNMEVGGWASLLKNKVYVDLAYYQMNGTNELLNIRQPDNSTDYQSVGKTLHRGIEVGLTYKPSKQVFFRFGGTNAMHQFVEFTLSQRTADVIKNVNGKEMPSAPRWLWNTELSYYPIWLPKFRTSIEWQHVSGWYQNQINTVRYPGYDLLNVRVGYQWKGVDVFGNILNLANALYATNATRGNAITDRTTFTPAAPRTFVMGIQYNFSGKK